MYLEMKRGSLHAFTLHMSSRELQNSIFLPDNHRHAHSVFPIDYFVFPLALVRVYRQCVPTLLFETFRRIFVGSGVFCPPLGLASRHNRAIVKRTPGAVPARHWKKPMDRWQDSSDARDTNAGVIVRTSGRDDIFWNRGNAAAAAARDPAWRVLVFCRYN